MKFIAMSLGVFLWVCGTSAAEPLLLPADSAYRQARAGSITLIDIRRPGEWRQTGVPDGAVALTMHNSKGPNAFYETVLAAVDRDKSRPIALICAAGNRSRWASRFLAGKGFKQIVNVAEGLFGNGKLPGWLARGLPVVPLK